VLKKFFLLLFILSTILQASNKQLDKVSIQLLWKHQFEFAGFYMAKEKGFYKEFGLEVDIKEFDFSVDITKDVESGKSTFGIQYPSIILDKSKGANVTILNALYQSSPHVFVTLKSSNINTIKDFEDKRVMMEGDTVKTASLLGMLYANKITNETFIKVKPSFDIEDLINGNVDIFSSYLSNEIFKLEEKGIPYNIFNPKDYGFDMYNDLLFTSQKLAKQNPELVYRFQQATLKGWIYAFENIKESVELIIKKYNTQNKSTSALLYEANVLKKLAYQNTKEFGKIKKSEIKRIYDLYSLMGLTTKSIQEIDNFIFQYDTSRLYLTQKEKEYLKTKKVLTFCVDPDWLPYEKLDNGKYVGMGSDYLEIFEAKLQTKFKLIPTTSWTESKQKAKDRVCDILPLSSNNAKRKEFMNVTTPYLKEPIVIATRQKTKFITSLNSLKNKKVGITKGYSIAERFKKKYPFLDVVEVENIHDGLHKVAKGELFGYIDAVTTINYYVTTNYISELKVGGKFDETYNLGMASNKDEPILHTILEKTIQTFTEYEHKTIYDKWNSNSKIIKEIDYNIILQIIAIIIIIISFLLYRQYLLNRSNQDLQSKVDEKTKELQELNRSLEEKIKKAVEENTHKDTILFQQSKMASMGEMIGNIAHQWRQPLTLISTTSTGLLFKLEYQHEITQQELKDTMNKLNDTAQYLSTTINDFQNFLKPSQSSHEFNLKDVVNQNIEMFGKAFSNNDIKFELDFQDIIINNNSNALLQVIINLMNNAKDALKESDDEKKVIFIKIYTKGENGIISIKDNAGGIPENILPNIFDAYFTTKHQSQGTGLGLYMSYQIVKNTFNGDLEVINQTFNFEGKEYAGAKFFITLPLK
jgi:ABC-type nitrate/sulfonate/bicarbonate transport system substrate-binding protein/signal transduction histidine kinase